jgi:hypothetical protein
MSNNAALRRVTMVVFHNKDRITDPEALTQAIQAEGPPTPIGRALVKLARAGMVVDSGQRRPDRSGKPCIVLVAREHYTRLQ